QQMHRGALEMVTTGGPGGWSAPVELLPAATAKNRYYPAFSPDGSFIVFNESTCSSGADSGGDCDADTDPTARLFAMRAEAGAPPLALAHANAPGRNDATGTPYTNTFPKWSPFVFRRGGVEFATKVEWLTFSSSRKYGLRNAPVSSQPRDGLAGTL